MPRRKRNSELDAVLNILREVRGILEAAGGHLNLPTTPLPQSNLADDDTEALQAVLEANARAEIETLRDPEGKMRDWRVSGTRRDT